MPCEFGDVVLVSFPFTSQAASKKRPAVVVSNSAYNASKPDVVIMAITSQTHAAGIPSEHLIVNWQHAGLLKPPAIKPVFATVEQRLLLRALGRLHAQDLPELRNLISRILG